MEELEQVYIRLTDGLIMFPIQGKDSQLFSYYKSEEPPITLDELKTLGFEPIENIIKKFPDNYLPTIEKFKKDNGSKFAKDVSVEALLMFLQFVLREFEVLSSDDGICVDSDCYCGKYKLGDVMKNCSDGGCMYPGA